MQFLTLIYWHINSDLKRKETAFTRNATKATKVNKAVEEILKVFESEKLSEIVKILTGEIIWKSENINEYSQL
jgi:hypothetical protein